MGSKNDLLMYAVIGLVAFCAFANTLGHGFVYDDNRQILQNPLIQRPELFGKALTSDVWAFKGGGDIAASNYYRPTCVTWMIVNWRLFGASPTGWHGSTVLLHVLVCLLLFTFLRRLGCENMIAAIVTVLFAVHPVHVENVAWISGATDPLMGIFLLTSLILAQSFVAARRAKSRGRSTTILVFSVACYLLAIGAKEIALFCLPLYWLIFRDKKERNANFDSIKFALPYIAVAVGFFIVRIRVLGALFLPVEDPVQGNAAFLSISKVFIFYVRQMFVPLSLGPALPIRPVTSFGIVDVVIPLILSICVIWGLWILARRSEIQTFGLALFVVTLLPVLNPGNFGTEQLVHDRYLYLPLAGLLIVLVPAVVHYFDEKGIAVNRKVLVAGFAVLALALCVKTFMYNRVWSSSETLWRYAVTIDPGSSHAWIQLGSATAGAQESLNAFDRSLQIKYSAVGLVSKARALIALGRFEDAIAPAREAISFDAAEVNAYSLFQAYEAETFALVNLKRYNEAETSLKVARQRLPIYYAALTEKLAVVLYTEDRKPEALAELEAVRVRARSEYLNESKRVFLRLGMLYAELGRKSEAKSALEEYLSTVGDAQNSVSLDERRSASQLLLQLNSP